MTLKQYYKFTGSTAGIPRGRNVIDKLQRQTNDPTTHTRGVDLSEGNQSPTFPSWIELCVHCADGGWMGKRTTTMRRKRTRVLRQY